MVTDVPTQDRRGRVPVTLRLLLLSAVLAAGSLPAWLLPWSDGAAVLSMHEAVITGESLPLWGVLPLLLLGFVAAEASQLHFELRRQTYSVSLSEVPLVVGLLLVAPLPLLLVRLGGYALVATFRRVAPVKATLNVCLFTLEVGLAAATAQVVGGWLEATSAQDPSTWAATLVGVIVAVALGGAVVAGAIALIQRPLTRTEMLETFIPLLAIALLSTTIGLLTVILILSTAWTLVGLALTAGVLVVGFRRTGRLLTEHKSLGDLYELTRDVASSVRANELDQVVLARVRALMRAEVAQLWIAEGDQLLVHHADSGAAKDNGREDQVRRRVLTGESVLASRRTPDVELRAALATRGALDLVAVPLRVSGRVVGSLEVIDRQGERSRFVASDLTMLETLAVHTGVALENARLVTRLRHEADHDPLTGLINRRAFVQRLEGAIVDAERGPGHPSSLESGLAGPGGLIAVCILDLQSFKDVNDTLGRAAGDRLLQEVVGLLRWSAPDAGAIARLSSDEFGIFLHVPDLAEAREAAASLQESLQTPMTVGGVEMELGAAVGIAVYPEHGSDAVELVQRADVAMYAAKRTSRGILAYSPTMDAPSVRRFGLVAELRRALEAEDLEVFYQPQVRLDTSELVGLEALVRWQHPEHGFIPPDEFVPVAEHTGLIGPLTSFVLDRALRDLRGWLDQGHGFSVSVNLSARSLLDPGFAEEVAATLAHAGIGAELLTLEITESSVMNDPERAIPVLEQLQAMGVRLSVDDFGIGQSSLTYLRRLPVAEVKIDRSFVSGMVHDRSDLAIVRAVIELSNPLGLAVVAEGVESEETRRELAAMGCATIQGYLLSRPLPQEGMDAWIERRTSRPAETHRRLRVVNG